MTLQYEATNRALYRIQQDLQQLLGEERAAKVSIVLPPDLFDEIVGLLEDAGMLRRDAKPLSPVIILYHGLKLKRQKQEWWW